MRAAPLLVLVGVLFAGCTQPHDPAVKPHQTTYRDFVLDGATLPSSFASAALGAQLAAGRPGFNGAVAVDREVIKFNETPLIPRVGPTTYEAGYNWTSPGQHGSVMEVLSVYPDSQALDLGLAQMYGDCLVATDHEEFHPLRKASPAPNGVLVQGTVVAHFLSFDDFMQQPDPEVSHRVARIEQAVANKTGAVEMCSLPIPTGAVLAKYVASPADAPGYFWAPLDPNATVSHLMVQNPGLTGIQANGLGQNGFRYVGILQGANGIIVTYVRPTDPGGAPECRQVILPSTNLTIGLMGSAPAADIQAAGQHLAFRLGGMYGFCTPS